MEKLKAMFGELYDKYYLLLHNEGVVIDPDKMTHRFLDAVEREDNETIEELFRELIGKYKHKYLELAKQVCESEEEYRANKIEFLMEMESLGLNVLGKTVFKEVEPVRTGRMNDGPTEGSAGLKFMDIFKSKKALSIEELLERQSSNHN